MPELTERIALFSAFRARLWAMPKSALDALLASTAHDRENAPPAPETLAVLGRRGQRIEGTNVEARDGVAIITLDGPLMRGSDWWWYGSTYENLARDLNAAKEHPSIHAIVLQCNSPGGDVNGMLDFAELVFGSRGVKPITAVASGLAASACFVVACAADEIVIGPNAEVGSLGVFCALYDWSGMLEKWGIKEYVFTSEQSPRKNPDPATAEGGAEYQALVNAHAQVAIDHVAKYRGITAEAVLAKYGQGRLFIGADAVSATVADRVGLLDQVVTELASRPTSASSTGVAGMTPKTAQFSKGAKLAIKTAARDPLLAEGDDVEVIGIRRGAVALTVKSEFGTHLVLAQDVAPPDDDEDEDTEGKGTEDDEETTPGAQDDDEEKDAEDDDDKDTGAEEDEDEAAEEDDEDETPQGRLATRLAARFPAAVAVITARAQAAERQRVRAIQGMAAKLGQAKLGATLVQNGSTPEAAAKQLIEAHGRAGAGHLTEILQTEAGLTPPAAAPRASDAAPEKKPGNEVIALLAQHDPKYRSRIKAPSNN